MRGFKKLAVIFLLLTAFNYYSFSAWILLPMDENQKNHLKAYGITYWVLAKGLECEWLLNYRGGSFVLPFDANYEKECKIREFRMKLLRMPSIAKSFRIFQTRKLIWKPSN